MRQRVLLEDFETGWANGTTDSNANGVLDLGDTGATVNGWLCRSKASYVYQSTGGNPDGNIDQFTWNWNWNAMGKVHGYDLTQGLPVVVQFDVGSLADSGDDALIALTDNLSSGYWLHAERTSSSELTLRIKQIVDADSPYGVGNNKGISGTWTDLATYKISDLDAADFAEFHTFYMKITPTTQYSGSNVPSATQTYLDNIAYDSNRTPYTVNTISVWSDLEGSELSPVLTVTDQQFDLEDLTHVAFSSGWGPDIDNVKMALQVAKPLAAKVVDRQIFDASEAGQPVFVGKGALLAGGSSQSENIITDEDGVTGIMIDVFGLVDTDLDADDFVFKAGNTSDPSTWSAAPTPASITVAAGGWRQRLRSDPDHVGGRQHSRTNGSRSHCLPTQRRTSMRTTCPTSAATSTRSSSALRRLLAMPHMRTSLSNRTSGISWMKRSRSQATTIPWSIPSKTHS